MNNVFSAKSETFAERCATKKTLRSCAGIVSVELVEISLRNELNTNTIMKQISYE